MIDFGQSVIHVFDIDRLLCMHAIAACEASNIQVYELCSDYYKLSTWILAYAETIYLMPPKTNWDIPKDEGIIEVLPPPKPNKRGRPKEQRLPSKEKAKEVEKLVSYTDTSDTLRSALFQLVLLNCSS
ncbi:hypothetical protein PanWU01x14_125570 [Parasponia andersonii]|uniref:Uncharacterized protein n=1 Tax=Parasponia andersonii TaxID=3476 RepID=A0A2P5CT78_PARAD|nr:hypothetical protein PanWU01x14_125570 [Parasponia andersonii]